MDKNIFQRVIEEIKHWIRPQWGFEDVGNHWDDTEDYDDINEETYSYFRRFTDGYRLSDLPENSHTLDICARTGNGTLYFYEKGKIKSAVCAGVSIKMGEICQKRLREGNVRDFKWIQIFDYDLPFDDGEFDVVLCFETVEHFSEPERLIQEIGRITKNDGVMILTTPNVLWEPIHALAAIFGLHHSEGPHRFIKKRRLRNMVIEANFLVENEETTVLIPGGPEWLIKVGEYIEKNTRKSLMPLFGLRRILVCKKVE